MKKRIILFILMMAMACSGLFAFEVGILGGKITNPGHTIYGISAGMGFLVPLIKFEAEYCRISKANEISAFPNTISFGVKIRPKLGKFSPYAIVGVGADFMRLNLHLSEYDKFSFIGGGLHYHLAGMVSLRADIRFLNYSFGNRTRFTGGIFIHI